MKSKIIVMLLFSAFATSCSAEDTSGPDVWLTLIGVEGMPILLYLQIGVEEVPYVSDVIVGRDSIIENVGECLQQNDNAVSIAISSPDDASVAEVKSAIVEALIVTGKVRQLEFIQRERKRSPRKRPQETDR